MKINYYQEDYRFYLDKEQYKLRKEFFMNRYGIPQERITILRGYKFFGFSGLLHWAYARKGKNIYLAEQIKGFIDRKPKPTILQIFKKKIKEIKRRMA